MGIFDNIGNAKATSGGGNWVRAGNYRSRLGAVKITEKYNGEQFVAIEQTIVEVLGTPREGGHVVGEDVTHLLKVANDMFLPNMKQFVASTLGVAEQEVGPAECERVTSPENPLAGIVVEFKAEDIKTKKGMDFTKVIYMGEVEASSDAS